MYFSSKKHEVFFMIDYYKTERDGQTVIIETGYDLNAASPRQTRKNRFKFYSHVNPLDSPDPMPDRLKRDNYDLAKRLGLPLTVYDARPDFAQIIENYRTIEDTWMRPVFRDAETKSFYMAKDRRNYNDSYIANIHIERPLAESCYSSEEELEKAAEREIQMYNFWEHGRIAFLNEYVD